MENLLVWILIFAGATIGLLAAFLIASERQLQKAEAEEESSHTAESPRAVNVTAAYATPRGQEFPSAESSEKNDELTREVAKLTAELHSSRATVTELQEWLIHSQRRQENLADRAERLEAELDRLKGQPETVRAAEADDRDAHQPAALETHKDAEDIAHLARLSEEHQELTRAVARLEQQLAAETAEISQLESARRAADEDNFHLRSQLDALRQQLDDNSKERERWQQAQQLLSTLVAKQTASAENAQAMQQTLLQLTNMVVAHSPVGPSENTPEAAEETAIEATGDAVELTEGEVFSIPPQDSPQGQPRRRRGRSAEMASSALAIAVFLVAIGILASQTWRLNPDAPMAGDNSTTGDKSSSHEISAAAKHDKATRVAGVDSDSRASAEPAAK